MIVELADFRPHMVIQADNKQHVVPVAMMEAIASGRLKVSDIDEIDSIMAAVVNEWIQFVMG